MPLFPTPEEKAERQRQKQNAEVERQRMKEEEQFRATPIGQARSAREAGAQIFQIDLSVSTTSGWSNFSFGTWVSSSAARSAAGLIERIESEGWKLENVGYVYRVTGSVSTGKLLGSGEREVNSGEIVGIYIFRAQSSSVASPAGA